MKLFTLLSFLAFAVFFPLSARGKQDDSGDSMVMEKSGSMMMMAPLMGFENMDKAMMLADEKPTVLFFYATWCPTCNAAKKDFEDNAVRLEGVNILVVDYDNSADLKMKYGITYQHTFVQISSDGKELAKWNGGGTDEFLKNIKKQMM